MSASFTVTINGEYVVNEIPPRCRKPRPVTYDTTATVHIPTVTTKDAPVAFRCRDIDEPKEEFRLFDNRLYSLMTTIKHSPITPGSDDFPAVSDAPYDRRISHLTRQGTSAEDFQRTMEQQFSSYLIIDDAVWQLTGEPRYMVITFGLGNNHGGTSLMHTTRDNENIVASSYFRADEYDQALAHAIAIAEARNDTHSVAKFRDQPDMARTIDVLIPEAVTLITSSPAPVWVSDLRWDYRRAVDRLSQATSHVGDHDAFHELHDLRKRIISAGFTPLESWERPFEARHTPDTP